MNKMKNIKLAMVALISVMILGLFSSAFGAEVIIANFTNYSVTVSTNTAEIPNMPGRDYRVIKSGDILNLGNYLIPDDFKIWISLGEKRSMQIGNEHIYKVGPSTVLEMPIPSDYLSPQGDANIRNSRIGVESQISYGSSFSAMSKAGSLRIVLRESEIK